jgi:hypothetical protein
MLFLAFVTKLGSLSPLDFLGETIQLDYLIYLAIRTGWRVSPYLKYMMQYIDCSKLKNDCI